jgi:hypothetical protein
MGWIPAARAVLLSYPISSSRAGKEGYVLLSRVFVVWLECRISDLFCWLTDLDSNQ